MTAITAQSLVRTLGARLGEYVLSAPTSGTTTTLVDAALDQFWPQDQGTPGAALACWVYGADDADASNRGEQRRASKYTQNTHTLTFLAAWPAAISTGHYEIYQRHSRDRLLDALNSGIRQISQYWWRPLEDTTITTASNTWEYPLSSQVQWTAINQVQMQIINTFPTYPYANADAWSWQIVPVTNASGTTSWKLRFQTQPPPDVTLRLVGEAGFNDLALDSDYLALWDPDAGPAQEWLYDWARYKLMIEDAIRQPMNQTEWLLKLGQALAQTGEEIRQRLQRRRTSVQIITPGRGQSTLPGGGGNSVEYMGVFSSGWLN